MTKEEAELVLDNARPQTKEIDRQFYDDEDLNNALDMGIKSLRQKTSEDCVSLEVYKQIIYERDIAIEQLRELGYELGEKIRISDDCVNRQAVIDELNRLGRNAFRDDTDYDNFFAFVDSLPPVTPTHGTCKDCRWLVTDEDGNYYCIQTGCFDSLDFYCADYEKRGDENEIN